jgi:regulator of replication initiation timing
LREAVVTDAERIKALEREIDSLHFHLMRALDENDDLVADREELRVKLALRTRQLKLADDLISILGDEEERR